MLLDRLLYQRILNHLLDLIDRTSEENSPFPHILLRGVFPEDVYRRLLAAYPSASLFVKANPKHHSNEYGGSTRQRMALNEASLSELPVAQHILWATIRAAISCQATKDAIFSRLTEGLCRRFGVTRDRLPEIKAYARAQLYSEQEGYRIAPHPDTREKIVTMQFAFPDDNSLHDMGTEFYVRSLNPLSLLREPRGFTTARSMPFLPNHAYAFSVLNSYGLKSWHGRSTLRSSTAVRNSLLHIWYAEPDESDQELADYQKYLQAPVKLQKVA